MNPLLLKPEADTHSQVVLMGQVSAELTAMPWRGRSKRSGRRSPPALDALRAENDVVVIEGAGSPAEINLHASDIVNMRVARHAQARCLLVTDIDRGGAFAHLYGTWALLPEDERALIAKALCSTSFGAMPPAGARAADAASADRRAHRGHHTDVVAARPARRRRRL
jgi:adenosylcobyric acid synthase